MLVFASWCVGEGGETLGKKYDASVIGGLIIAWLNTGNNHHIHHNHHYKHQYLIISSLFHCIS